MKSRYSILSVLLLTLIVNLFTPSCAHQEASQDDPEGLFAEAEELYKDDRYLIAIEKYRDIKNRFPYSSRATDAELRIADSYFAQESFLEAESAYEIFRELHPTHPRGDYVQYRIGLSYFRLIPENSARDLASANRAIEAFGTLFERYPGSEFVAPAKEHIHAARKKLAENEFEVGDFYFSRKHFLSASNRYNSVLEDFSDLGFDREALFRLGQCYFNIRQYPNAKNAFLRLQKEFPNSAQAASANSFLNEIGKLTKKGG